jgi:hypothetical protein
VGEAAAAGGVVHDAELLRRRRQGVRTARPPALAPASAAARLRHGGPKEARTGRGPGRPRARPRRRHRGVRPARRGTGHFSGEGGGLSVCGFSLCATAGRRPSCPVHAVRVPDVVGRPVLEEGQGGRVRRDADLDVGRAGLTTSSRAGIAGGRSRAGDVEVERPGRQRGRRRPVPRRALGEASRGE